MLIKTALAAALFSAAGALPVAVPLIAGWPVTVSVGVLDVALRGAELPDVSINTDCILGECPLAQLRVGPREVPVYPVSL